MYMKKYIFLAASALALASCSSDDFVGTEGGNVENGANKAINFGGGTGKITRASEGEAAATLLDNNFVVVGFKGSETEAANTNLVFDHYNVNYATGTANTTASNTKGWEYVGQKQEVNGANKKLAADATKAQTIKYWDNSCSSYDFLAFSMGKGYTGAGAATKEYATPTAVNKENLKDAAYTLTGDVNTLGECYISDMATVVKGEKGYSNKAVNMQFRHASSKVRIALYEIVPGYVISDVKFHSDTYSSGNYTEGEAEGALFGTFNNKGTMTVYFPTTGTANNKDNNNDYNKAHIKFDADKGEGGTVTKMSFGEVNYGNQKEDAIEESTTYLSQSAAKPSYCGKTGTTYYQSVLPAENASQPANLRIDYKLTATDGSGEEINVKNATVTVPAKYTAWKHGYAYTYIFKISQNTNGTTGKPGSDDTGLTAISFDAVVLDDEVTGKQETITTVSDPSITTYGFKDGKVTTGKDEYEYETGTDIYATAFVPETTKTTETGSIKVPATTAAPQALYTVTIEPGAAQTINEASIANALTKNPDQTDGNIWTITDANNKKMIITKVTTGTENVTSVPTEDGHNLEVNALKWTGTASTIYAVEYTYGDNKDKKAYKIVTVK